MFAAILSAALLTAPGSDTALEPWASKAQPGDVAKSHVEKITTGEHKYTVVHGGTMDGENCRTPMGCGMNREGAIEQSWQSNRAVRMENVGQTDVVNPWLSNGRNNFRNIDEIVASAVTPGMSDREKAMALWFQQIQHRFHRGGDGDESRRPGEGLQRLRPQPVRERRHDDGRPVAEGGTRRRPRSGWWRTPSPRCITTAAGT